MEKKKKKKGEVVLLNLTLHSNNIKIFSLILKSQKFILLSKRMRLVSPKYLRFLLYHLCSVAQVTSGPLGPNGPSSLLCPWDFPSKNTGVRCHALLQGSFRPRDQTCISCFAGSFLTCWAIGETLLYLWCQNNCGFCIVV